MKARETFAFDSVKHFMKILALCSETTTSLKSGRNPVQSAKRQKEEKGDSISKGTLRYAKEKT
jgi:hypothetical protein